MKNRLQALLFGLALTAAAGGVSHAMSELVSVSIEPEWPATSNPGTVILYKVTAVDREGQGLLEVSLSSSGLPEGATVSFSPDLLRFTGRRPSVQSALMTVTCTNLTVTDTCPFTVAAHALRQDVTITNQVQTVLPRFSVAPPQLAMGRQANGDVKLRGTGGSGQTYQIEAAASVDHPVWTPVGSSTADGNGRFSFIETPEKPMRFYRAVWPVSGGAPVAQE